MRLKLAVVALGTMLGAGCSDLGPEAGLVVTSVETRYFPITSVSTPSPGVTEYRFETTVEVEVHNTTPRDIQLDRCTSEDAAPAFGLRQAGGAWSPLVPSRACTSALGVTIAGGETVTLRLSASSSFLCDLDQCPILDQAMWRLVRVVLWANGDPVNSNAFAVMPPVWCYGVVAGILGKL
jgi:hypothetical protein